jgi:ornithine cyclodeaminase/alanine dehydrogenase-like protein (mu-crystallin family)
VVSNANVNAILDSLSRDDLFEIQDVLKKALASYTADPSRIPERIVVKREDLEAVHLFMPSFADRVGIKTLGGSKEGFKGMVSVMDENNGELLGVVNAFSLTAFRTALASSLALTKFVDAGLVSGKDQHITVFGNGAQAYWHVKLTLLLYPSLFNSVLISVRTVDNEKTLDLLKELSREFPTVTFEASSIEDTKLDKSSVIYGCIPSTEPGIRFDLLSTTHFTFISMIGSYKPHMFECDDEIVEHALQNGKIIIDSKDHTLHEAGELIKNGVVPTQCIELGELDNYDAKDITHSQRFVLTKIVGLSIMDVSVATDILNRSVELKLGVDVEF